MIITIYNIDGAEIAKWHTSYCFTPSFQRLPNHDWRCPYGIRVNDHEIANLDTGMSLNHAIRQYLKKRA